MKLHYDEYDGLRRFGEQRSIHEVTRNEYTLSQRRTSQRREHSKGLAMIRMV